MDIRTFELCLDEHDIDNYRPFLGSSEKLGEGQFRLKKMNSIFQEMSDSTGARDVMSR